MDVKVESIQTIKVELTPKGEEPITLLLDWESAKDLFNGLGETLRLNYRAY